VVRVSLHVERDLIARLDVEEAVGDETCYVIDGDGVVLGCVAGEDGDGGAIGGGGESAEEGGEEGDGVLHVGWRMGILGEREWVLRWMLDWIGWVLALIATVMLAGSVCGWG
jgi:hypothetical protein